MIFSDKFDPMFIVTPKLVNRYNNTKIIIAARAKKILTYFVLLVLVNWSCSAAPPNIIDKTASWKKITVVATNLTAIDNLVVSRAGDLYATQERRWFGKLIKISRQGDVEILLTGLNRADGLLLHQDKLYVTEEVDQGRVIEYDLRRKTVTNLMRINRPEGIDVLSTGELVISEDKNAGRLIKWSKKQGQQVLLSGLNRPEGVCVSSEQTIYIAETGSGRILRYVNGKLQPVLTHLNNPDQIECHQDGSLWISEDTDSGRLLRFKDGNLEIIAKQL